jgi:hypothetical protein
MPKGKDAPLPRLLSKAEAAAYCGVTQQTFAKWVAADAMPDPLPVMKKWDRKSIDATLDQASGLSPSAPAEDAFEKWKRERDARKVSANHVARRHAQNRSTNSRDAEFERLLAMTPDEYVAACEESRRQWVATIPKTPMIKREQNALRQILAFGGGWADAGRIKDCGQDTVDRLVIRGFIETKPHDLHPKTIVAYRLTEAGLVAVKALPV